MSYTLPAGWFVNEDFPGHFESSSPGDGGNCDLCTWLDVLPNTDECWQAPDVSSKLSSKDLIAWVVARDGLVAIDPQQVTVAGLPGYMTDVSILPSWTKICAGDSIPVVPLFVAPALPGGEALEWGVGGDEQQRIYVLDRQGGGNIVIAANVCCGTDFATRITELAATIDSLQVGDS